LTAHITVCVCTFKRSGLLPNLLEHLEAQHTEGLFTYEVVIIDNDSARSAESVVRQFAASSRMPLIYCVEPEQNIAVARNTALAQVKGDFAAFIDDDEVPGTDWLFALFQTSLKYRADAVLGPVMAQFEVAPPAWIERGRFFDRPRHETGYPIRWPEARTGNVLLAARIWCRLEPPFRPAFDNGGEDVDFFRRLSDAGHPFVWCDEALVHEWVPPHRATRRFLMRRALLRGSNFPKQSGHRLRNVLKSIVAIPCYTLALPVLAVRGQHVFVAYLVKLLDHISRLLAMAGVRLSTERQH
jgi:glycosyltransferase involved in cell wall biosynthesis